LGSFEYLMSTAWKCPYIRTGRLPSDNDPVGKTETVRIDISIPKSIGARVKHSNRRVLVLLNSDDNARKHLLRLFGIARSSNDGGTCCQENKCCSKCSHGDVSLIYRWSKNTQPCEL